MGERQEWKKEDPLGVYFRSLGERWMAWISVKEEWLERKDGFKIYFGFYAKSSHRQIKITALENMGRIGNKTVQILFLWEHYTYFS